MLFKRTDGEYCIAACFVKVIYFPTMKFTYHPVIRKKKIRKIIASKVRLLFPPWNWPCVLSLGVAEPSCRGGHIRGDLRHNNDLSHGTSPN